MKLVTSISELLGFWNLSIFQYSKKKNTREHNVSETGYFCPQVRGETPPLDPLERANFNHWTTYISITTAINI
jgi:hypothetical protein